MFANIFIDLHKKTPIGGFIREIECNSYKIWHPLEC